MRIVEIRVGPCGIVSGVETPEAAPSKSDNEASDSSSTENRERLIRTSLGLGQNLEESVANRLGCLFASMRADFR